MRIDLISAGDNPPEELNVLIEVPIGGEPVKYEFDKASGALFVDRILHTPMRYPANYGFIPHTLSPDGDPLDALVVSRSPFIPGCVVRVRPIAVLKLEDEAGGDEKLLTNKSEWREFLMVKCESWRHGNVVILGDAAHTTTPHLASGASIASS